MTLSEYISQREAENTKLEKLMKRIGDADVIDTFGDAPDPIRFDHDKETGRVLIY